MFAASWLLSLPKKAKKKKVLRGRRNQCALPLIGQCVAESLGGSIVSREEIDL